LPAFTSLPKQVSATHSGSTKRNH